MIDIPPRLEPHVPLQPLWICRGCGQPWPCAGARLSLTAEYADNQLALTSYLAGALYAAINDLYQLNPHDGPNPDTLFDRFLGWARRNRPPASGRRNGLPLDGEAEGAAGE